MSKLVRNAMMFIVAVLGVVFVIMVLFRKNEDGNFALLDGASAIVEQMHNEAPRNDSVEMLQEQVVRTEPIVRYTNAALEKGDALKFKEQLEVIIGNQTWNGNEEHGFTIYLQDIKDTAGNSRLVSLDSESIDASDEIFSDFVYDTEQDILYIHGSGCYVVYIKIYTETGFIISYEFVLPVE